MDRNENAFFEDIIIYQESSDSEHSEKYGSSRSGKENKKKITSVQREILLSVMDGRSDCISKGKIKTDEKTIRLLSEWNELTTELNSLGPPHHTSQEWRRIWTKMKSNKKRKAPVLGSQKENKKVKGQHNRHENNWKSSDAKNSVISTIEPFEPEQNYIKSSDVAKVTSTVVPSQCHRKWSDWDSVISTIQSVESEGRVHPEPNDIRTSSKIIVVPVYTDNDEQITGNCNEREFSHIVHEISSLDETECHRKWSDWDSVISTIQSVESEGRVHPEPNDIRTSSNIIVVPVDTDNDEQITGNCNEREFSHIVRVISSLAKRQEVIFEMINKKLDLLAMKQNNMHEKLHLLSKAIGINIE